MRENEYEHLKQALDAPTGGPNGSKTGVFSELARQLTRGVCFYGRHSSGGALLLM